MRDTLRSLSLTVFTPIRYPKALESYYCSTNIALVLDNLETIWTINVDRKTNYLEVMLYNEGKFIFLLTSSLILHEKFTELDFYNQYRY